MNVKLRKTIKEDLDILFVFQTDEAANYMAAFSAKDPHDKAAYMEKWTKIIENPLINMQSILVDDILAGSVLDFELMGQTNLSYWIGKPFWGKGLATRSLKLFVQNTHKRPLFARVAFDNTGSQRVLEKNGLVQIGKEKGFANARQTEIEEWVYILEE